MTRREKDGKQQDRFAPEAQSDLRKDGDFEAQAEAVALAGNDKKARLRYFLSGIFMILILAGTFAFIFKGVSLHQVAEVLRRADPRFIALAVLMMFIFEFAVAVNIKLIIDATTDRGTDFATAVKTAFIGFYFNNVTPSATGGQPMEMYYLHRKKINLSESSVLFILLAIFYNIAVLSFGFISFLCRPQFLRENLSYMKYFLLFGYAVLGGMTLILLLMICKARWLRAPITALSSRLKKARNQKVWGRAGRFIDRFYAQYEHASEGFVKHRKVALYLLPTNLVQVFAYYMVSYFACRALGAGSRHFWDIFTLQSNLYIASASVPTPGMVGVMEAGFVTMFKNTLPPGAEVSAMLLSRMISLYGFMILAGAISIYAFIRLETKEKSGAVSRRPKK